MMGNSDTEEKKWTEEDLLKMSYKYLKKIARQSNVNPNCKKAELVKALLYNNLDRTEQKENTEINRRITRSRASIYQRLDVKNNAYSQPATENYLQATHNCNEMAPKTEGKTNKKRQKVSPIKPQIEPISDMFTFISSIKTKEPFGEITNKARKKKELKSKRKMQNISSSVPEEDKDADSESVLDSPSQSCRNEKGTSSTNFIGVSTERNSDKQSGKLGKKKKASEQTKNPITDSNNAVLTREKSGIDSEIAQLTEVDNMQTGDECQKKVVSRPGATFGNTNGGEENHLITATVGSSEPQQSKRGRKKTDVSVIKNDNIENKQNPFELPDSAKVWPEVSSPRIDAKYSCKKSQKNKIESSDASKLNSTNSFAEQSPKERKSAGLVIESDTETAKAEIMPVPVVRSSTFILEDYDSNQLHKKNSTQNQFELPKRSDTFILEDTDEIRSKQSSLKFLAAPESLNKCAPAVVPGKFEKSIGKRILSVSVSHGSIKSASKQNKGSTVKKTITKSTTTPGSVYKKLSASKKLPNFKKIHQNLFSNMESIADNRKRKLLRAQELIQSPVPKCAISSYSPKVQQLKESAATSTKKAISPMVHVPTVASPSVCKANTPNSSVKPYTSVNRFGFKNRIKKEEAKSVIGNKLPLDTLGHKKDDNRKFLEGVRMNKRFMLQMKMRQAQIQKN